MNKNTLLKMGACACAGALIGFGIDMVVKKRKQKEVKETKEIKVKEVKKIVKEKKSSDELVKMVGIIFGSIVALSLIETVSAFLLMKLEVDKNIWDAVVENRKFNELNFVTMVCHICDTDTTMSEADKIVELTKLVESNKLGDAAVNLLKEQINELMEAK